MFDRYAWRLYDFFERHRRPVRFALLILLVCCIAALFFIRYESSMEHMLPDDPVITRSMRFFQNSDVTGKVAISFGLNDPAKGLDDLLPAVDAAAAALDRTVFTDVLTGVSDSAAVEDVEGVLRRIPALMTRDDLSWIEGRMTRSKVDETLRGAYLQLLKPQGMFLGSIVRTDPLGLKGRVLQKVGSLAAAVGYNVDVKEGHLVSRDGRHVLVVAKTPIAVTDSEGSKRLLAAVQTALAGLPPFVTADVVAGHAHSVSNERLIKTDVNVICTLASIAFIVLYVLLIRDWQAIVIFLVPVIAIVLSIPLTALLLGKISYWVIGLGSTMAGITIDYSTHVFFAVRGRDDPGRYVKHVIKPLSFGALTSIAVFLPFFFARSRAYTDISVVSILCIVLATGISLFVLPHVLANMRSGKTDFIERAAAVLEHRNWSSGTAVVVWLVLTGILTFYATRVQFEQNIRRIDGTESSILREEERFHAVWGGDKSPAIVVSPAPDLDGALALNESVYRDASRAVGPEAITSLATIWPSAGTLKANEGRWRRFWSPERKQRLRTLLVEEGARYGFSKTAFDPFFTALAERTQPTGEIVRGLTERFVQRTDDGYQVLSFFPETREAVAAMQKVVDRHPGAYLVSSSVLARRLSEVVSADLKLMLALAAALVMALTYLAFWSVRETIIAMVPPLTSVVWLLGLMAIMGMALNIANMIAGVLVIGLTSDYGIFMTFRSRDRIRAGTVLSITLCSATTVMGAGVLYFARHPALFSIGVTTVVGILSGYLAALFVVPKLCELWMGHEAA